jgi:cyclopropane-fatty-acyl-phospholipid synthase
LVSEVVAHSGSAGFELGRIQPLGPHYARTLDIWANALETHHEEAVAIQSEAVYERYMKYLTGSADLFRAGYADVCRFTLAKS